MERHEVNLENRNKTKFKIWVLRFPLISLISCPHVLYTHEKLPFFFGSWGNLRNQFFWLTLDFVFCQDHNLPSYTKIRENDILRIKFKNYYFLLNKIKDTFLSMPYNDPFKLVPCECIDNCNTHMCNYITQFKQK